MASRTLNVSITGDSRDLQRALGQAGKSTADFEKKASASSKVVGAGFRTLAGVAGAGALVAGLRSTVKAAQESQVSQAKLEAQMKASGLSYRAHAKEIDNVIQKVSRLSGLDDEDLQDSFTNIVRATKNVNEGLKLTAIAADIARAKHMDVATAGQAVAKVYNGQYTGLKRLGIAFTPTTAAQDKLKASTKKATDEQIKAAKAADANANRQAALAKLQQTFSGSAEKYGKTAAGAQERFGNAVENLQEKLGSALLPTLTKVSSKAAKFVDEMTNGTGAGGRFAKKMEEVFARVKQVAGVLIDSAKWLGKHPGLLKAAAAAWVAYKSAALIQIAIVKTAELGLFGGSARAKATKSAGSAGTAVGKTFATKAGLAAAAGIAGWEIGTWLRKNSGAIRSAGNFLGQQFAQAIGQGGDNKLQDFVNRVGDAQRSSPGANVPAQKVGNAKPPTKRPRARHSSRITATASSAGITAHASGEAGGAELGSIQRAAAWVHANFPGVGTLIENAGGANQHLHIEGPQATVIKIGKALQAAGFAVGENPAFGGVHPVHSHGGLAGIPGDHYTGNAIDVNSDYRSLSISGGGGAASGGKSTASTKAKPKKKSEFEKFSEAIDHVDLLVSAGVISQREGDNRKLALVNKAIKKLHGNDRLRALTIANEIKTGRREAASDQRQTNAENAATAKAAKTVDKTLSNPWLNAALNHIDYLVASGQMGDFEGRQAKANILFNALPGLVSEADKTSAIGQIADLGFDITGNGLVTRPPEATDTTTPDTPGEDPNQPLIDAQNEAAEAARQQTEALNALKDEMKRQTDFATSVAATEAGAMARWVTSVVNRVQGQGVLARTATPAYGVARRS